MSRRQAHKIRRRVPATPGILPDDLYDYMDDATTDPLIPKAAAKTGSSEPSLPGWTVFDDWPERLRVTEAEVDIFDRYFADLLDELFGASRP